MGENNSVKNQITIGNIGEFIDPLVAAALTSAIYTAKLIHATKGSLATDGDIAVEVTELWTLLITRLKQCSPGRGDIVCEYFEGPLKNRHE